MAIDLQKLQQKFDALFEDENIVAEFEQWLEARNVSQNCSKPHVSGSFNHSILDAWKFAEWVAYTYVRLHDVWVHKYADQRNKDNWKDTGELWKFWWENFR